MFQRLRVRLSITFIALAVVPLIVVGVILGQLGFQQLEQEVLEKLNQLDLRATSEIESYIDSRVTELRLLTEVDRLDERSVDEQSAILGTLLNLNDDYEAFQLLDTQGQELIFVSRLEGVQVNSLNDFSNNDAFSIPSDAQETYYGEISFGGTREPIMTIAHPIINLRTGNTSHVLVSQFRFRKIWDLIAEIDLDATETVYVVDQSGQVIAHSNPSIVLRNITVDLPDANGIALGLDGDEVVLTRNEIKLEQQSLIVVVEQPTAQALALATNGLYVTAIIILIALVIAIVSIVFSVRDVVQPIEALSSAAQAVSEGDLSVRINLIQKDEIGALGRSFNQMTENLQQSISDLEHQITVADQARERAERSDQVKSAFLASMSHELRTPLNSIINFTKFVSRGIMGPINERQESNLNRVIASGQHLLSLINDVLDMSKIEAGSLTLFIEDDVSIDDIVDSALASAEVLIADKPIELRRDIDSPLPVIQADRKRITQIFLNIISNACKYTQEGYIDITVKATENTLHLTVQDTGLGIAEEDYDGVFESFKQTTAGLRQGEGTGLGLPITKSLVEAHNGRLWFTSELGVGTTFFVEIPIHTAITEPVVVVS